MLFEIQNFHKEDSFFEITYSLCHKEVSFNQLEKSWEVLYTMEVQDTGTHRNWKEQGQKRCNQDYASSYWINQRKEYPSSIPSYSWLFKYG